MGRRVRRQPYEDLGAEVVFWNRHRNAMKPERNMWAQCLEEAVECVMGRAVGCGRIERQRIRAREMRWFYGQNAEPGSYLWICMVLNYDPDVIREELAKRLSTKR